MINLAPLLTPFITLAQSLPGVGALFFRRDTRDAEGLGEDMEEDISDEKEKDAPEEDASCESEVENVQQEVFVVGSLNALIDDLPEELLHQESEADLPWHNNTRTSVAGMVEDMDDFTACKPLDTPKVEKERDVSLMV